MDTRPVCDCHSEPMLKNGRGFRCRAKHHEYRAANRDRIRERDRDYAARPDVQLRKKLRNMARVRLRY